MTRAANARSNVRYLPAPRRQAPPALAPDSLALASLVDGVLLVADAKQTDRSAVSVVRDEFDHLGDKLIGAVFNRAPRGRQRFYV